MKKVVEDPHWEVPNSLTDEFCDDLIKRFAAGPGQDMVSRCSLVLIIQFDKRNARPKSSASSHWKEEDDFICKKLTESVNEYYFYLKKTAITVSFSHDVVDMNDTGYHIQRYTPNIGFYTWHNDYHFDENMK